MKKALSVLAAVVLLLSACGEDEGSAETAQKSNLDIARDVAQDIMDCFIDKDEEKLYSLFSTKSKKYYKLEEQIEAAFDFIDGEIISYELPTDTGGGGYEIENGKTIADNMTPWIYIETDSGKMYRIVFQYFTVFVEDRNGEGLYCIIVSLLDNKKSLIERIAIGFDNSDDEYDVFKFYQSE